MTDYKAPLRDIEYAMFDVNNYESHYASTFGNDEVGRDLAGAITSEYAKFCENVLTPLYRSADEEGCTWTDGEVTTPAGFKDAYQQYIEAGWPGLSCDPEMGGQGLPLSLALTLGEMTGSANIAFALYTGGLFGAIETLSVFGDEDQRAAYESNLVQGLWNATMCLTEPHCGTDLGLLKTKAEPDNQGAFAISGTKIFITGGEHDLAENIVHLVLARLPDAPEGNKGISLFIVPKLLPEETTGELTPNGVSCGAIEHKMGIKGSATCTMYFERAKGFMLGEPNRGLQAMFKFINASRVRAAFQGVSHAELGYQKSLAYAKDRLQMRSASGVKNPDGPADPIIVHPNVRRMLLTQKVFAEGNRMMLQDLAKHLDIVEHSTDPALQAASSKRLDLMTPIAKGFATETGYEAANHALQCFGGHGYIREWGVEQNVRDARIAMLYEGTTGVQALDLIGRKVVGSQGALLEEFCEEVSAFAQTNAGSQRCGAWCSRLQEHVEEWKSLSRQVAGQALKNPDELGAASLHYLMYSGYVSLAYYWARSAIVAEERLAQSDVADDYLESKLKLAAFYFDHILPRTRSCVATIEAGAENLMALHADHFAF